MRDNGQAHGTRADASKFSHFRLHWLRFGVLRLDAALLSARLDGPLGWAQARQAAPRQNGVEPPYSKRSLLPRSSPFGPR
jgi:hypothetical protein